MRRAELCRCSRAACRTSEAGQSRSRVRGPRACRRAAAARVVGEDAERFEILCVAAAMDDDVVREDRSGIERAAAGRRSSRRRSATWRCWPNCRVVAVPDPTTGSPVTTAPAAGPTSGIRARSSPRRSRFEATASRSAIQTVKSRGSTRRTMGPARTTGSVIAIRQAPIGTGARRFVGRVGVDRARISRVGKPCLGGLKSS